MFQEKLIWMVQNGFVEEHRGKYKFTMKAYKELKDVDEGLYKGELIIVEKEEVKLKFNPGLVAKYSKADWTYFYESFILQAKVPKMLPNGKGGTYPTNKFSADGLKAFTEAVKSGVELPLLLLTVQMYYNANRDQLKKAIGNYMTSGEWRTDYLVLKEKYNEGSLKNYVDGVQESDRKSKFGK